MSKADEHNAIMASMKRTKAPLLCASMSVCLALTGCGIQASELAQTSTGDSSSTQPQGKSGDAGLRLVQTIPLPGVEGRFDHFAVDPARQILYVAALGNDTLEVLEAARGQASEQPQVLAQADRRCLRGQW